MRNLSLLDDLISKLLRGNLTSIAFQTQENDAVIDHIIEQIQDQSMLPPAIIDFTNGNLDDAEIINLIERRSRHGVCIMNAVEHISVDVVQAIIARRWLVRPDRRIILLGRAFEGPERRLLNYLLYLPI